MAADVRKLLRVRPAKKEKKILFGYALYTPSIFYKHQSISTNLETRQIFEKN